VIAGLFPFIEIPGLGFDPFIRGWLVAITGVLVLMGSVYLILATNTGVRTGLLIAVTGLFAWMTIMGAIWWIYGIGLRGPAPAWDIVEVNRGDLASARLGEARRLGEALEAEGDTDLKGYFEETEIAVSEQGAPVPEVGGWDAMLLANPARGEAQATVDAYLVGQGEFEASTDYVAVGAFEEGGKHKRPASAECTTRNPVKIVTTSGCWERAGSKLYSIFVQPRHPTHYATVLVQAADPRTLISRPGQPPPLKEVDPNQPVIAVVMVRDLGSVRVPPAMITIGSLIIFVAFAKMLHDRDRRQERNRALVPAGTGGGG
jgi:hypothetical protein